MEQENIVPSDTPTEEEAANPENSEPEVGLPADQPEVEPKDEADADADALRQKNQELYEQLKKAKGFIRDAKTGKWVKKEAIVPKKEVEGTGDITKTELYSLVKANVPDEDVNEVVIYARSHNISATEALKKDELKAMLKVRAEYRKTEEAANINISKRSAAKVPDDVILNEASKGNLPDDPLELARARFEAKKAKVR